MGNRSKVLPAVPAARHMTYTLSGKLDAHGHIVDVDWRITTIQREHIAIGQPFVLLIAVPGANHQIRIEIPGVER